MGNPLRQILPDKVYHISNRALDAMLMLLPQKYVNEVIGEWLARGQKEFDVEIFEFLVASVVFAWLVRVLRFC